MFSLIYFVLYVVINDLIYFTEIQYECFFSFTKVEQHPKCILHLNISQTMENRLVVVL